MMGLSVALFFCLEFVRVFYLWLYSFHQTWKRFSRRFFRLVSVCPWPPPVTRVCVCAVWYRPASRSDCSLD